MLDEKINVNYNQNEFKESNFGIRNKSDMVHLFNVMRNKIYANKPLAVIREYSTNANDAHIESGKKGTPIKVTLPTASSQEFVVQDFGTGLSEEDVRNIYTMYGASTKRGSTELNGQMGLGSKSAFAYGDRFKIISVHEGVLKEYEAYVDETKLGAIALIKEYKTDAPSGITIKVPVKLNDVVTFQNVAKEFYTFFNPTPEFTGTFKPVITTPKTIIKKDDWKLVDSATTGRYNMAANAIMGNVCYPLDLNVINQALNKTKNWEAYYSLLSAPLLINFKVGDLNIAASRESLEYDSTTLTSIVRALDKILLEASDVINQKIDSCKDIVHAKKLFVSLNSGTQSRIFDAIKRAKGKFHYKNTEISSAVFVTPNLETEITIKIKNDDGEETEEERTVLGYTCLQYRKNYARTNSFQSDHSIEVSPDTEKTEKKVIYVRDNKCNKPVLRIKNVFALDPHIQSVHLFELRGDTTLQELSEGMGLPLSYFHNLSQVEPIKVEKEAKPVNKKYSKKFFKLTNPSSNQIWVNSAHWEPLSVDEIKEEDKIYVLLDQYRVSGASENSWLIRPNDLKDQLNSFFDVTRSNITNRIVGVKETHKEKIPETWKLFSTYVKEELAKHANLTESLVHRQAVALITSQAAYSENIFPFADYFTASEKLEINDSDFNEVINFVKTNSTSTDASRAEKLLYLGKIYKVEFPVLEKQKNEITQKYINHLNAFKNRYPLIPKLSMGVGNTGYYYNHKLTINNTNDRRMIIDYIKQKKS